MPVENIPPDPPAIVRAAAEEAAIKAKAAADAEAKSAEQRRRRSRQLDEGTGSKNQPTTGKS